MLKEARESLAFRRDLYRFQRKLMGEIREERDKLHEKYFTAKCTLAKWIEWARMHGHLDHAGGIADDSQRIISLENNENTTK